MVEKVKGVKKGKEEMFINYGLDRTATAVFCHACALCNSTTMSRD